MAGVLELVRLMQKLSKLVPVAFSQIRGISVVLCLSCNVRTRVSAYIDRFCTDRQEIRWFLPSTTGMPPHRERARD